MKTESKKSKPRRGKKTKISFDEEVINKDQAEKLLSEQSLNSAILERQIETNEPEFKVKNKKRKLLEKDAQSKKTSKAKKKQTDNQALENDTEAEPLGKIEQAQELVNQPKKESNRAQKRKKHAELVEQKKLKLEIELQQKALNYLSKWKHSRSEWKFEKLKQIWIQQNLFDASKIPDEFWETSVEYFQGAKGYSRQTALDEALKIIEKEEESTEENLDEDYQVKLKRARNIVQNLQ